MSRETQLAMQVLAVVALFVFIIGMLSIIFIAEAHAAPAAPVGNPTPMGAACMRRRDRTTCAAGPSAVSLTIAG